MSEEIVAQAEQTQETSQPVVEESSNTTSAETTEVAATESTETNEATDATGSEESDEEGSAKKSNGFMKRIERFERRLAEKEAEINHWRNAALTSGQKEQTQPGPAQAQVNAAEPKFEDYNDVSQYVNAVTDWKLAQREVMLRQQSVAQTYAQKEAEVRSKNPDYEEVLGDFKDRYKNANAPEINQFLIESDIGPEVLYHLANNYDVVDRLLTLPPMRRVAELGKIEATLTSKAAPTKPVQKVSKAPPPVTKEKGVAPVTKRLDDPNLSQAEYRQLRTQGKPRY